MWCLLVSCVILFGIFVVLLQMLGLLYMSITSMDMLCVVAVVDVCGLYIYGSLGACV